MCRLPWTGLPMTVPDQHGPGSKVAVQRARCLVQATAHRNTYPSRAAVGWTRSPAGMLHPGGEAVKSPLVTVGSMLCSNTELLSVAIGDNRQALSAHVKWLAEKRHAMRFEFCQGFLKIVRHQTIVGA